MKPWLKNLPLILLAVIIIIFAAVPVLRANLWTATEFLVEADFLGLRRYVLSFGWAAPAVSFFLMIFQAFVSPIPSILLFTVNAAIFGGWQGFWLSWFSSLASAWFCFGLARRLGRPLISKLVKDGFLARVDRFLGQYGSPAVLVTRVVPFMPFDFTSYAFGVTRVSWWDFTWGTACGQTPAIVFYSFLGHRLFTPAQYILYLIVWILVLLVVTLCLRRLLKGRRHD
ncbi:MAG: TVP38/TMEM64 family protein [Heliobacteriaceae bacterium]|nr:TVP38/TMEM64 family protein [Heliobacteriaceae bacterium]